MNNSVFNIAIVERDTGLSKDVLRMWERRYGFPKPDRDAHGDRIYPADQVERLVPDQAPDGSGATARQSRLRRRLKN
ncbi:MAG: MerR family transcriptional regulator [Candidatus Competibacteraceae bacterium]